MPNHLNYAIRSVRDEAGAAARPDQIEAVIADAAAAGRCPQRDGARIEVTGPPRKIAELIVRKPDRNPEAIFYFEPAISELERLAEDGRAFGERGGGSYRGA